MKNPNTTQTRRDRLDGLGGRGVYHRAPFAPTISIFMAQKKPPHGTAKQVIRESGGHMSSLGVPVLKDKPVSGDSPSRSRDSALRGTK